jgi:hypothetical protein
MNGKAVRVEGRPVEVPVSREVRRALTAWAARNIDDLNAALEPFGLTSDDIAAPAYMRFLRAEEVRRWVGE